MATKTNRSDVLRIKPLVNVDPEGERCTWPRCRQLAAMSYRGRPLCNVHWGEVCQIAEDFGADQIARLFPPLELEGGAV